MSCLALRRPTLAALWYGVALFGRTKRIDALVPFYRPYALLHQQDRFLKLPFGQDPRSHLWISMVLDPIYDKTLQ